MYDGYFTVVHNGIIENYVSLREKLEASGVVFSSETDTETVPHLVAKYYRETEDFFLAVKAAVNELRGSFALGILCSDCPDTLIAVKKESPLIIGCKDDESFIASDVTALVSHTKNVIYLDDGEIAVIRPGDVSVFGFDGEKRK